MAGMTGELTVEATSRLCDNQAARELCGGVSRPTLLKWRRELGFPQPLDVPMVSVELFDAEQVRAWFRVHQRERATAA